MKLIEKTNAKQTQPKQKIIYRKKKCVQRASANLTGHQTGKCFAKFAFTRNDCQPPKIFGERILNFKNGEIKQ